MSPIRIKRVYDPPAGDDGQRILVERLWPRGLTKQKVAVDLWLKDIAPCAVLRKWFAHDPAKWAQFKKKYWQELRHNQTAVDALREQMKGGTVILIYAAHDQQHNSALALKDFLEPRGCKFCQNRRCFQEHILFRGCRR